MKPTLLEYFEAKKAVHSFETQMNMHDIRAIEDYLKDILKEVAEGEEVSAEAMLIKSTSRHISDAKMIYCYLAKYRTSISEDFISSIGNVTRSRVYEACKVVSERSTLQEKIKKYL